MYASAQKFVDSLKKSAVKTEPILQPDRVQRVNMESLLGKRFFIIFHIPLLFLALYSPPPVFYIIFIFFLCSLGIAFKSVQMFSVAVLADPGPGSGIGFFRISGPGSPTYIFESLVTIFG